MMGNVEEVLIYATSDRSITGRSGSFTASVWRIFSFMTSVGLDIATVWGAGTSDHVDHLATRAQEMFDRYNVTYEDHLSDAADRVKAFRASKRGWTPI